MKIKFLKKLKDVKKDYTIKGNLFYCLDLNEEQSIIIVISKQDIFCFDLKFDSKIQTEVETQKLDGDSVYHLILEELDDLIIKMIFNA